MSTLGHQYDNSLVSNAFGFLRLPMNFMPYDSDADWVITGVPFDMATSGRAGGRHGPAAIRQVSTNLAWEHNRFPWNFDVFPAPAGINRLFLEQKIWPLSVPRASGDKPAINNV